MTGGVWTGMEASDADVRLGSYRDVWARAEARRAARSAGRLRGYIDGSFFGAFVVCLSQVIGGSTDWLPATIGAGLVSGLLLCMKGE